ncbi:Oidioi.mRNA.OKI2018_I69.chr2.g5461.t1.cds [Oikopleura dioica]|uniref:Oidioi.mRNA.OKI2018_I69.chr2.g5461.t1.cds n=1 Tax=Oikopleura dioica TaxID=34765 RepID=A0ABN7T6C5_OIKDI|nr:Oidioi.mRNA.OKI2018_I69.chr2.g5461.t1.cds [Oikopleura dioica]
MDEAKEIWIPEAKIVLDIAPADLPDGFVFGEDDSDFDLSDCEDEADGDLPDSDESSSDDDEEEQEEDGYCPYSLAPQPVLKT